VQLLLQLPTIINDYVLMAIVNYSYSELGL